MEVLLCFTVSLSAFFYVMNGIEPIENVAISFKKSVVINPLNHITALHFKSPSIQFKMTAMTFNSAHAGVFPCKNYMGNCDFLDNF